LAKFNFTIQGSFETDDSTQALLQLSHLAEVTKINMNEKFKLEFTNINVTKHVDRPDWAWGPQWERAQPSDFTPFHYHNEATVPTELEEPIPFDLPKEKVVPQPWKDKMKGEGGLPVD
jgi:hypothetical protein